MSGRILIVDDSLTVRMHLAEAFEAAGFQPLPCATVSEARTLLWNEAVDAAILDVILPDGNGIDLLVEIRSSAKNNPVIVMLSTESEVKDRIRGLQQGADEYVGKPFDIAYVIAKVREGLRARQSRAGVQARVLIIDDSITFRETLRDAFEKEGYTVSVAPDGEEGLRIAALERPAAILVDGVLPGIDGGTVIRRIRLDAALRSVPCLLLTASEDHGAELRALDSGADAFVRKGDGMAIVLAKLGAVLRGAAVPVPATNMASLQAPKRILAVDDSRTYLHELSSRLRDEGYDVICASSGEEALELLAVQPVDCVLLDLVMPGMSGEDVCRQIKSAPAVGDVPVVMLTAVDNREAMIRTLSAGADDYLAKSSEFEVLKARVRVQLRRKQYERENRMFRAEIYRHEMQAAEARAAREIAETRAALVEELERKNRELEAFGYSVSHDLRAPLRSIDGFSQLLQARCGSQLDDTSRRYLETVRSSAQRMGDLIEGMLSLSRLSRREIRCGAVNLTDMAKHILEELRERDCARQVEFSIADGLDAFCDANLMRIALVNLLGNAWKFTARASAAKIEFGRTFAVHGPAFFVRDNGAGFDMAYAEKLFAPFQRLHADEDFQGTGIGLATVYRVIDRHGGRVWAESAVGQGATFLFTLPGAVKNIA